MHCRSCPIVFPSLKLEPQAVERITRPSGAVSHPVAIALGAEASDHRVATALGTVASGLTFTNSVCDYFRFLGDSGQSNCAN
jgi:hypothetical protein